MTSFFESSSMPFLFIASTMSSVTARYSCSLMFMPLCAASMYAGVGGAAARAGAEKLACHQLEMVQVLDVLKAGLDEWVGQMCANHIIDKLCHSFSSAESLIKCRCHRKLLLMFTVFR